MIGSEIEKKIPVLFYFIIFFFFFRKIFIFKAVKNAENRIVE